MTPDELRARVEKLIAKRRADPLYTEEEAAAYEADLRQRYDVAKP